MSMVRAYIAGGHVYCQVDQRDQDVALCQGCPRMAELNDRSSPPYIACRIDPSTEAGPDRGFLAWWFQHHRRSRAR